MITWVDDQLPTLTMFLLQRSFGVDDGQEPESQSSVEMMAACKVLEQGVWRQATDAELNEISHHDDLESRVQLEEERKDLERRRCLECQQEQEERRRQMEAAEAQSWDRRTILQELGTWPVRATKRMRMSYTVRQDDGTVVGQGSRNITVAAASRGVSITNHFADLPGGPVPTTAARLQNQVEPDVDAEVGSQPHDAAVLLACQDLQLQQPEHIAAPSIEGLPQEVVDAYYRLFVDRALADELVEERLGASILALFRQHRFEREGGQPMLHDLFARPQLWQDFAQWHRGALADARIVELYGNDVLHQFQMEQRLQGGHTPPAPAAEEEECLPSPARPSSILPGGDLGEGVAVGAVSADLLPAGPLLGPQGSGQEAVNVASSVGVPVAAGALPPPPADQDAVLPVQAGGGHLPEPVPHPLPPGEELLLHGRPPRDDESWRLGGWTQVLSAYSSDPDGASHHGARCSRFGGKRRE